jgi:hypothetical protein
MDRHVRGAFFADYVRMLRRRRRGTWEDVLLPGDIELLNQRIDAGGWYPMDSFERFGVAILRHVEGATLDAVRLWGRFSVNDFVRAHPELIAPDEPTETLMRLKVLRATLFDFPAFDVPMLAEGHAHVDVSYYMGPVAEEAACVQTLGFCEGVLSLAGAVEVEGTFVQKAWEGAPVTRISLEWRMPGGR